MSSSLRNLPARGSPASVLVLCAPAVCSLHPLRRFLSLLLPAYLSPSPAREPLIQEVFTEQSAYESIMLEEVANKTVLPRPKRQILNKNTNECTAAHAADAKNEKKKARRVTVQGDLLTIAELGKASVTKSRRGWPG